MPLDRYRRQFRLLENGAQPVFQCGGIDGCHARILCCFSYNGKIQDN
jgi:hypothetical protein